MNKGIDKFEVYKLAERLERFIYKVTETFPKEEKFRSVDQLRRSASSVADNISEGYHRYSYGDKIHKMHIARGEAGETRDGIIRAFKKGFTSEKIADFVDEKYTELIKRLNAYVKFLRTKKQPINQSPINQ